MPVERAVSTLLAALILLAGVLSWRVDRARDWRFLVLFPPGAVLAFMFPIAWLASSLVLAVVASAVTR